jgi:transmembrane sensor
MEMNGAARPPSSQQRHRAAGPFGTLLMPYTAYSTDDFLADESFQSFVIDHDPVAEQFWRTWVAQHPAKQVEFDEAVALLQLLATSQSPRLPQSLKRAETAKLWQALHAVPRPQPQLMLRVDRRARRWVGAALGALALGFAGLGLWQRAAVAPASAWTSYVTKAGEHRELTLPDGSRVTLNANSVLKLATAWQPGLAREVWLTGEAFFRVRHTAPAQLTAVAAAPANVKFTVHAGPLDVAVLGTQFDVLNRPGRAKVVLQSGQVQLRDLRDGQLETLLKPGELAELRPAAPLAKRPVDAALYAAWTSGHLDFADTPVTEVIALLEDTYGLRVTLGDPALRQQKLSGSVPSKDLDVLLATIAKSLDTNVHRTGNHVRFD